MVDLPIGKAIIAVLSDVQCKNECNDEDYHCTIDCCKGCDLLGETLGGIIEKETCVLCCLSANRRDGKHVIFKLVDYPAK
jgi:hypothetical protein